MQRASSTSLVHLARNLSVARAVKDVRIATEARIAPERLEIQDDPSEADLRFVEDPDAVVEPERGAIAVGIDGAALHLAQPVALYQQRMRRRGDDLSDPERRLRFHLDERGPLLVRAQLDQDLPLLHFLPAGTLGAPGGGLRNAKGVVRCLLFQSEDGFPSYGMKALQRVVAKIADGAVVCEFADPPARTLAIAFIHDEEW